MSNVFSLALTLLELAKKADDDREYRVGGHVCIERKGVPWRISTLAALDDQQATTENGYVYARSSGKRLMPERPSHDELRPLTRDRIDSLLVREFLELAGNLKHVTCKDKQIEQLLPVAHSFLSVVKTFDSKQFNRP